MRTIVVDVESYYDQEYSLRKMTPVEYILDHRWETIGWAVKDNGAETVWMTDQEFRTYLAGLLDKVAMVSHNALFDMCVLAWRYGYTPHIMIDTLGMARAWMGHKMRSLALASIAKYMGIGVKGDTVHKVQGMSLAAIKAAGFYDEYAEYSKTDADLCWQIYRALIDQGFPVGEIAVMDTVLRCAVQPSFVLNQTLLAEHLHAVQSDKQSLMDRVGLSGVPGHDNFAPGTSTRDILMSNDMFANALRALGVEPPTKISLVTGKEAYAFAKTDPAFIELEEHENPDVQALVSARLGVKSTIEETRTQRLLDVSHITWPGNQQRLMPMPLRYSGAHTHRLCLVGHTTIAVLRNKRVVYTRLDDLQDSDLVWDGEVFVGHGGLSYAGIKEVITYDGVTGTPEHRVWTVEHGYRQLADAKAQGYNIARGAIPDPTRVDEAMYRTDQVPDPYSVHMREVLRGDGVALVGSGDAGESLVSVLPQEGADGGQVTFGGYAGSGCQGERIIGEPAACSLGAGAGDTLGEALGKGAVKNSLGEMAGAGLEGCDGYGDTGAAALLESGSIELPVLRGAGDKVSVSVDSPDGGLDSGEPWTPAGRAILGSQGFQRALRTWESAVGDEAGAGTEPVFLPTWDIVDCGPRNRFAANGRIVHNSGDWKLNMQNLPSRGNNRIRSALEAPDGKQVVAVDASQIEARIAGWFCGADKLTSAFANREDVYSTFASSVFGYEVQKATHKVERFIGKTAVLGLQYGLGWSKFQKTVAMQSKAQVGQEVILDDIEATRVVQTYRREYQEIPKMWNRLNGLISQMTSRNCYVELGPLVFMHEKIKLPSGLYLHYHDLQNKDGQWWFTHGGKPKYLYGGKLLENIVQALARICVMDTAVNVRRRVMAEGHDDIRLNLQVHDELVYITPSHQAAWLRDMVIEEMCKPPSWGVDIPLDAEGDFGQSYGACK